jgi:DNA transposition AAA+ family ATPase
MSATRTKGTAPGDATHAAHSAANPAIEAGMSADIINIPDNVAMRGLQAYPEKYHDDLMWAIRYGRNQIKSRSRFLELLGYSDWGVVTRVYQGKYPNVEPVVKNIQDLRRRVAVSGSTAFVHTVVTRKIWALLDYALAGDVDGGGVVMISGATGRSKSYTAKEWAVHNNHGRSIYFECPVGGGYKSFLQSLAAPLGINRGRNVLDLEQRISEAVSRKNIILADEVYRVIPKAKTGSVKALEFLRHLHDSRGVALCLIATRWAAQEMTAGVMESYMEQLIGRIDRHLVIPDDARRDEVDQICAHFKGSIPSAKLVKEALAIAHGRGRIRTLFKDIRKAKVLADAKKQTLSEAHILAARDLRVGAVTWPADREGGAQ